MSSAPQIDRHVEAIFASAKKLSIGTPTSKEVARAYVDFLCDRTDAFVRPDRAADIIRTLQQIGNHLQAGSGDKLESSRTILNATISEGARRRRNPASVAELQHALLSANDWVAHYLVSKRFDTLANTVVANIPQAVSPGPLVAQGAPPLSMILDPGETPPDAIADILSDISLLYRLHGGSGISFTLEEVFIEEPVSA